MCIRDRPKPRRRMRPPQRGLAGLPPKPPRQGQAGRPPMPKAQPDKGTPKRGHAGHPPTPRGGRGLWGRPSRP
eukprot:11193299-Alexandrium_andersonii.AAC.1